MARQSAFKEILNPKRRAFLAAYAECGMLTKAAELADCDITSHYHWKEDKLYYAAFLRAREMAADRHEDEATRRAFGWEEERLDAEGTPYTVKKYSDTLLIVRLKALKPEEYRENFKIETEVTLRLEASLQTGLKRLEDVRSVRSLPKPA